MSARLAATTGAAYRRAVALLRAATLFAAFSATACSPAAEEPAPGAAEPWQAYLTAMQDVVGEDVTGPSEVLVVAAEPLEPSLLRYESPTAEELVEELRGRLPEVDAGLAARFAEASAEPFDEATFAGCPVDVRVVSRAELEQFFPAGGATPDDLFAAWERFHAAHRGAFGYWTLGRLVRDEASDEAVLQLHHHCGPLCGSGWVVHLVRENGRWTVRAKSMLWIS